VAYHSTNWVSIPTKIKDNIHNIFKHITPPLPNDLLRDKFQTLQTHNSDQLTDIVKQNFDRVAQDLTNTLRSTHKLHLEQAKTIKQRIHKIKHSQIQNSFQSSSNITGSIVTFTNAATQQPPVHIDRLCVDPALVVMNCAHGCKSLFKTEGA